MELMDLIEKEKILNYEVGLKNESLKNFIQFFEKNSPEIMGEIEKEYFHVFVQDTWSLVELKEDYNILMTKQDVSFKKTRHFLLETMAHHKQLINNKDFFSISPIRNFIVATIFVKKMVQWCNNKVDFPT